MLPVDTISNSRTSMNFESKFGQTFWSKDSRIGLWNQIRFSEILEPNQNFKDLYDLGTGLIYSPSHGIIRGAVFESFLSESIQKLD